MLFLHMSTVAAVYIGLVSYEDLGFNIKSGARYTWIVWVAVSNVIWLAFVFYLCYFSPKGTVHLQSVMCSWLHYFVCFSCARAGVMLSCIMRLCVQVCHAC